MTNTKPVPEGFRTVTPSLTFKDSAKALEFYREAFGATVMDNLPNPNGKGTMHATMKVGDSIIMMGDEMPGTGACKSAETLGGSPVSLFIYVSDADAAFDKAVAAGAESTMPVMDMFWGDRCGTLVDPFGYTWMIGTHIKDLSQEEIQKGADTFFEQTGMK